MAEREAEADAESQSVHCSAAWHERGRHPEWVVQKIISCSDRGARASPEIKGLEQHTMG